MVLALIPSHGSQCDVFFNGNIMSQYFNEYGHAMTRDKAEASAFKNVMKAYVAGLLDDTATMSGLYDASVTTAVDPLMAAAMASGDNTWLYAPAGAQGSLAFGNSASSLNGINTKYEVKSAISTANLITAEVQLDNTGGGIDHGFIYSPWATQGSSGNTTSIDNGVQTTNGGVLVVHTFNDTASLVVSLFDSANNSTFAAVSGYQVTCANTTTAVYRYPAAGTTPTGTIREFTRINWTGTGTFVAFFSRK